MFTTGCLKTSLYQFPWLMVDLVQSIIQGCIREQAEKPWEQASRQHPSMTSASAPASRFLPSLSSCPDFLWWWAAIWKHKPDKPFFPPVCFWVMVFPWLRHGCTQMPHLSRKSYSPSLFLYTAPPQTLNLKFYKLWIVHYLKHLL